MDKWFDVAARKPAFSALGFGNRLSRFGAGLGFVGRWSSVELGKVRVKNRMRVAHVGDVGLDLVQLHDKLLNLLARFLRLGSRLTAQKVGGIAEVEQLPGCDHE